MDKREQAKQILIGRLRASYVDESWELETLEKEAEWMLKMIEETYSAEYVEATYDDWIAKEGS